MGKSRLPISRFFPWAIASVVCLLLTVLSPLASLSQEEDDEAKVCDTYTDSELTTACEAASGQYKELLQKNQLQFTKQGNDLYFQVGNGQERPISQLWADDAKEELTQAQATLQDTGVSSSNHANNDDDENNPRRDNATGSIASSSPEENAAGGVLPAGPVQAPATATAEDQCKPIQDPKVQKELKALEERNKTGVFSDDTEDWVAQLRGVFETKDPPGSQSMKGSSIFSRCQALVAHNWRQSTGKKALDDLYWHEAWFNIGRENLEGKARNKNSYDYLANVNKRWLEVKEAEEAFEKESKNAPCPREDQLKNLLADLEKARKKLKDQLDKAIDNGMKDANEIGLCAALMIMMEGTNYDDETLGNPHAKVSVDQRITCKTAGFETQDFPPCESIINLYDASVFGEKGMNAVQEIDYSGTATSAQFSYALNSDDPTSALKAQKKTVQKRADITKQRAIFHGAKLASLIALYNSMPTHEDLLAKCDSYGKQRVSTVPENNFKKYAAFLQKIADAAHLTLDKKYDSFNIPRPDYCGDIITGEKDSADLILNTKAKDAIKAIMVEAGIEVGKNAMFTKVLGDQAKDLQEAIDKVDNYDVEAAGSGYGTLLVHKCQVMPNHPDCIGSGYGIGSASSATGGGYNINYSDNGNTTVGGKYVEPETAAQSAASNLSAKDYGAPIPGVEQPVAKNPTGIADVRNLAGRKGTNTPNGAGGGGAPGGMAPPGGGGSFGGGGGGGGGGGRGSDSALQYGKEAGSSAFYSGGSGSNGKENDKESKNPFADLFNKDGKNTNTNVRNLASIGPKELDLFVRINQRYSEVQKEDRLLKVDAENDIIK